MLRPNPLGKFICRKGIVGGGANSGFAFDGRKRQKGQVSTFDSAAKPPRFEIEKT